MFPELTNISLHQTTCVSLHFYDVATKAVMLLFCKETRFVLYCAAGEPITRTAAGTPTVDYPHRSGRMSPSLNISTFRSASPSNHGQPRPSHINGLVPMYLSDVATKTELSSIPSDGEKSERELESVELNAKSSSVASSSSGGGGNPKQWNASLTAEERAKLKAVHSSDRREGVLVVRAPAARSLNIDISQLENTEPENDEHRARAGGTGSFDEEHSISESSVALPRISNSETFSQEV